MSQDISQRELDAIAAARLRKMQRSQANFTPDLERKPYSEPEAKPSPKTVEANPAKGLKPEANSNPYSDHQKYRHKTIGWEAYFVKFAGAEDTAWLFIPEQDRIETFPLRMLEIDTPLGWAEVKV